MTSNVLLFLFFWFGTMLLNWMGAAVRVVSSKEENGRITSATVFLCSACVVPPLVLFLGFHFLFLFFSPIAQFNAHNPFAEELFHLWLQNFELILFGVSLVCVAYVVMFAMCFLKRYAPYRFLVGTSIAASLFMWFAVAMSFPRA